MGQVKAIVLRAAGINCDMETQYALESAGADAERVHINRMIENKDALKEYQILVIPGGFSYGDDVAAGKILANQLKHHLYEQVRRFVDDGKLVLGICNGFQVLVKAGLLPGFSSCVVRDESREKEMDSRLRGNDRAQYAIRKTQGEVTITYNDSNKYEDRWVYLAPQTDRCVFIEKDRRIYLPVAHGEGKVVAKDEQILQELKENGHIAFKYVDENGNVGDYPVNPNGSVESIAGFTDSTGRVLGLMPHPERFIRPVQHPRWTRLKDKPTADGMTIFNNAVRYIREQF